MVDTDDPNQAGRPDPDSPPPEAGRSTQSWWRTFPGVLTGVAAVITAVTGLLIALQPFAPASRGADPPSRTVAREPGATDPRPTSASSPSGPTASSISSHRTIAVPPGTEARLEGGDVVIRVLSVELDPYSESAEALRLVLRFSYDGSGLDRTYYTNVRVVVDGVAHSPEDPPLEQIDAHSAIEVGYDFHIPRGATQVTLRLIRGEEVHDLPLELHGA
jgi:hypothetical protein